MIMKTLIKEFPYTTNYEYTSTNLILSSNDILRFFPSFVTEICYKVFYEIFGLNEDTKIAEYTKEEIKSAFEGQGVSSSTTWLIDVVHKIPVQNKYLHLYIYNYDASISSSSYLGNLSFSFDFTDSALSNIQFGTTSTLKKPTNAKTIGVTKSVCNWTIERDTISSNYRYSFTIRVSSIYNRKLNDYIFFRPDPSNNTYSIAYYKVNMSSSGECYLLSNVTGTSTSITPSVLYKTNGEPISIGYTSDVYLSTVNHNEIILAPIGEGEGQRILSSNTAANIYTFNSSGNINNGNIIKINSKEYYVLNSILFEI